MPRKNFTVGPFTVAGGCHECCPTDDTGGTLLLPCCTDRLFPDTVYLSTSGGTTFDSNVTLPPISDIPIPFDSQVGGPGNGVVWGLLGATFEEQYFDTGVDVSGQRVYIRTPTLGSCQSAFGEWSHRIGIYWNGITYYIGASSLGVTLPPLDPCDPLEIAWTEPAYPGGEMPGSTWTWTE